MSDNQISTADTPSPGRPPAVLQVLPALVTGGVERGTVDTAKALAKAGWVSYVVSEGGPMVREIERAGGRHITLPVASKNPFTIRRNAERLAELIRTLPVDLVHVRSRAPAWSVRMAAQRTGVPLVTTFHNAYKAHNWFKKLWAGPMAKGDMVVAISDFVADYANKVFGVPRARLVTIPRGTDLAKFDPTRIYPERMSMLQQQWRLTDGLPVILLPGRLTRWKGHTVLLRALKILADRHGGKQDFTAVLLGSGREGYRADLESQIVQLGLDRSVRMPGDGKDMPAAYMLADVVVSASTFPEGFGRVAVEGQAMGKPVIATDHGGSRETVLPNGETGWLVKPGDPESLADALDEALKLTPERRMEIAARARRHVSEHFTVDAMCDAYIKVYTRLLFPNHNS